jgi:hypothetical protein
MKALIISKIGAILLITFVALTQPFSIGRWAVSPVQELETKLFLKATTTSDSRKSNQDGGRSVKTGTHTYATWRSPNQRDDNYDSEDYEDSTDDFNSLSDDEDDDNSDNIEIPSPILQWLKKLYDSVFFYGLDPAPPAQKSNRRKMMRDAENYEGKKSNSPFFTPSEQRVQRYMASMRNREDTDKTSSPRGQRRDSVQSRDSMQSSKVDRRRRVEPEPRNEDRILRQQAVRKPMSTFDIVKTLQEKLLDLTLELELINAEIATSSPTERNYKNLMSKKDDILDSIEDAEIDLVTAKSELL